MKTTPFDLKAALAGAKVVTREGKDVEQLVRFTGIQNGFPLRAVVDGELKSYHIDGKWSGSDTINDLVMEIEETTVYLNIYTEKYAYTGYATALHKTLELAREHAALRGNPFNFVLIAHPVSFTKQ